MLYFLILQCRCREDRHIPGTRLPVRSAGSRWWGGCVPMRVQIETAANHYGSNYGKVI